ncbi:MAG: PilT/PilU family type 4a pilus ATPase [Candidatus Omnitrophica bacterium]|nr:PilT/PilU family type 4a pilus ATPase [Candidatus Omnitrophota bacterium]MDD5310451.1 PilT/PilU family type 4a pilus ATPase [Candidatus Omnitrophota bacterium]MDD5546705.1 PilT/PilU family type 4a pilus ATPase [Candidatus Omnitrophota bacterium]
MDIKTIFRSMVDTGASDIFLKVGSPINFRIDGLLKPQGQDPLAEKDIRKMIDDVLNEGQKKAFEDDREIDFALNVDGIGRFRGSVFHQDGKPGAVFRFIKGKILSFDELNLPSKVLTKLSVEKRGLILVTGATGSGKSTTIASIIEYINQNLPSHVVTIEDPIEFTFADKRSLVEQRELGIDTPSYLDALKHVMYQSPDVIFIGNIRDQETMTAAMNAAETGQLVVSTIHSVNATQTVERVVNFYPPYQHEEIRMQLSLLLKGIIAQRLIPIKEGKGRIPACEIMLLTPTISSLIREGKTNELLQYIEEGNLFGMQTFDQCLARFCLEKKISVEDARRFCDSEAILELALKGIKRTERGTPFSGR